MEVIGSNSNLAWSQQAVELIEQLVDLDRAQTTDKEIIFDRFYEIWENDGLIVTVDAAKSKFNSQKTFIKECIFNTLPSKLQVKMNTEELIYNNLQAGMPYTTPENKIIPVTQAEINRFRNKVYANRAVIHRRFTKLYNEFEDYIHKKRNNRSNNTFVIEPLPLDETETRESLPRDAKSKLTDGFFKGSSTSNSEGNKKRCRPRNSEVKQSYTMLLFNI